MAATPSPANVLLGRGSLFFDRFDVNGVKTGMLHLGNAEAFSLNTNSTQVTMTDYTQLSSAPYALGTTSLAPAFSLTLLEFNPDNIALGILGNVAAFTQTTGTVTAETLAPITYVGLKGKYFRTIAPRISAVTVKQGATTLVLGTDYTIENAKLGLIRILPTSVTVVDGTILTIDYTRGVTVAADGIKQILGAAVGLINGTLTYVENNPLGQNQVITVWNCAMKPNGDIALIGTDFAKMQLSGTAVSDAVGTYGGSVASPFFTVQDLK